MADLNTTGDGLLTLDPDTGLAWLDLTLTDGLSVNQVLGGTGGLDRPGLPPCHGASRASAARPLRGRCVRAEAWPEGQGAERRNGSILYGILELLREGTEAGVFRAASEPHTVQTLIGATVYHFASGEFGEKLPGSSLSSSDSVQCRKAEVKTPEGSSRSPWK